MQRELQKNEIKCKIKLKKIKHDDSLELRVDIIHSIEFPLGSKYDIRSVARTFEWMMMFGATKNANSKNKQ